MTKKQLSNSVFLKWVKDTIKHYDMLHEGDRVLVAVSGGPDSVGLLGALYEMRKNLGIEIIVGNLDHGIRGKESRRDSELVELLSKKLGLLFVHGRINLRSRAGGKKSLEEKAREERYSFLLRSARKNKCNVIATAHTLDDQAETVLMRVITGSSAAGLAGIPPVRNEEAVRIIRPFVRISKKDILAYIEKAGMKYAHDRTNLDVKIRRNWIRLEVIPFLEKVNPRVKRSLVNLADAVREDLMVSKREEADAFSRHMKEKKSAVSINLADIMLQPRAVRKAMFKESVRRAGGNIKKLTYRHWMDMDLLLRAGKKGKALDLPGKIQVTRTNHEIVFSKR
ncbi:MAG: tRNA lysidine(34) synthetase TilS [Candidatus Omnitrophota bacterium]